MGAAGPVPGVCSDCGGPAASERAIICTDCRDVYFEASRIAQDAAEAYRAKRMAGRQHVRRGIRAEIWAKGRALQLRVYNETAERLMAERRAAAS